MTPNGSRGCANAHIAHERGGVPEARRPGCSRLPARSLRGPDPKTGGEASVGVDAYRAGGLPHPQSRGQPHGGVAAWPRPCLRPFTCRPRRLRISAPSRPDERGRGRRRPCRRSCQPSPEGEVTAMLAPYWFRAQAMASRRGRSKDSPTRWRFRLPSPGTFRLRPCGSPRTASGPGFNLIALRGRRSRDGRPSLRPGKSSPRVLVALYGDIGAPALRPAVVTRGKAPTAP